MTKLQDICRFMDELAPLRLAEDWDNVGLLVGDPVHNVERVMTCLTITPASCREAIELKADLIIAHHPMPFRPLKRLTTETTVGKILLDLISAGIAIYSPHTSFDSAQTGINQQIAEGLGLEKIEPLSPFENDADNLGSGRWGTFAKPQQADEFCRVVKDFFGLNQIQFVGDLAKPVQKVAVACGSAGQFLELAFRMHCDAFVTGETNFHTCLEAEATNTLLVLPGHFATERFAIERLAQKVQQVFSGLNAWVSQSEIDPLKSL